MALVNPCNIAVNPSNTGSECSDAMKATAMLIMVPKNATWTTTDLADFTSYVQTKIHATPSTRWFPIFGSSAPVRGITEANESDVIETMEDGSVKFIRYGMYNRTLVTTEGGLCLAQALMAMGQNYSFIEVDITGQVAMMKNIDGTFSGFPLNLGYAPAPMLANLKTAYKNQFMTSFSPLDYVKKGKIFASDDDEDLLGLRGLYDTVVFKAPTTTQTTTNIFVGVKTECAESDLVEHYGATLAVVGNFIVKHAVTGAVVTPSAAAVVNGEIRLTGTYVTANSYTVELAAPSVLKAALIVGYEGTEKATVPIP